MATFCPENQSLDAIVPIVDERPQVLHSIYHKRIEATIRRISHDRTYTPGIASILKELNVLFLYQEDILRANLDFWSFFDIDTKEDLESAESHLISLQQNQF